METAPCYILAGCESSKSPTSSAGVTPGFFTHPWIRPIIFVSSDHLVLLMTASFFQLSGGVRTTIKSSLLFLFTSAILVLFHKMSVFADELSPFLQAGTPRIASLAALKIPLTVRSSRLLLEASPLPHFFFFAAKLYSFMQLKSSPLSGIGDV